MVIIKKIIEIFSKMFNEKIKKSEIVPYFKSYSLHHTGVEGMNGYLKSLGTPMSPSEYEDLFKEKINKEVFIEDKENFQVLTNIYDDVKAIYDNLKVLEKLGVIITLDLTGGAVRDFVMGKAKNITDLDIMFSFNDTVVDEKDVSQVSSVISSVNIKTLKDIGFNEKDLLSIGWSDSEEDLNVRKVRLIELCLLGKVEKAFYHTEGSRNSEQKELGSNGESYIKAFRDRLCGVIKLKNQKNYKIDILITDFKKYEFLQEFDINLCKASFVFKSKYHEKDFPSSPEHLLSRFLAEVDFFADIHNKKLTIDINNKSSGMLDSILNKHLPKLMLKYPDYEFNLVSSGNLKPEFLAEINSKIFSDKLGKLLYKNTTKIERKIKI